MSFKLKPFVELVAMTKEKFDEAMAPIRARSAKAKAQLKQAEMDEKLIDLEHRINEACATKDINFDRIVDLMDEYALLERRRAQVEEVVDQLFPE